MKGKILMKILAVLFIGGGIVAIPYLKWDEGKYDENVPNRLKETTEKTKEVVELPKQAIGKPKEVIEIPREKLVKEEIFKKEEQPKQPTREQYKNIGNEKESKYNSKDNF